METREATPEEQIENMRSLNELHKLFPRLPKRDYGHFLMSCTAFPFCDLQFAVKQAEELSRRCSKSVERAYLTACRDLDSEMRKYKKKYPRVNEE